MSELEELVVLRRAIAQAVRAAVKKGELVRPVACERCGRSPKTTLHGHHHNGYDISHWFDVQWLCNSCHSAIHSGVNGAQGRMRSLGLQPQPPRVLLTHEQRSEITRRAVFKRWGAKPTAERTAIGQRSASTRRARYTPEEIAAQSRGNGLRTLALRITCECGRTMSPPSFGNHVKWSGHKKASA